MKTLGLRMVPIFNDGIGKLEALSDSDFANDKDTRYSVYGYIIYFCCVPVVWKSKSMKSVVLSTTEAEYVAVSEVVKEIKVLYQMLRSMEIRVPLPIKFQVESVGARTKHVDLRAHFVRDMIKDQVIEIKFVKSVENDSDIMTKNQQGQHCMYAKVLWQKQHIDKREIYKHKAHLNTALSTTVAEYIALSTTLQEQIPLMNLLQEVMNKGVLHKISTTNFSLQYF